MTALLQEPVRLLKNDGSEAAKMSCQMFTWKSCGSICPKCQSDWTVDGDGFDILRAPLKLMVCMRCGNGVDISSSQ